MVPPEIFAGLTSVGWTAIGAIATCVVAALTLGSVIVISQQLRAAHRQHAEGIIERGSATLAPARSELQDLQAVVRSGERLALHEARRVRDVFFAYESYVPIFELTIKTRGHKGVTETEWYVGEVEKLLKLLGHLNSQTGKMIEIYSADVGRITSAFLDKVEATATDRKKVEELRAAGDIDKLMEFINVIVSAHLARKGSSASDIAEFHAAPKIKADVEETVADVVARHGGDPANVSELKGWLAEVGDMLDQVEVITNRIGIAIRGAK